MDDMPSVLSLFELKSKRKKKRSVVARPARGVIIREPEPTETRVVPAPTAAPLAEDLLLAAPGDSGDVPPSAPE